LQNTLQNTLLEEAAITVLGEKLRLLPQKAIYWESKKTLLISDNHFGKTSTFLQHGVLIPQRNTEDDLERISALLEITEAERIVFLGDFFHARAGKSEKVLNSIKEWRESHKNIKLLLIRGNHDNMAGDPPGYLEIECCNEPCMEEPFVYRHNPEASDNGYVIAGHVHPSVKLRGKGRQAVRLPCFYFTRQYCIMPAFGSFTGMFTVAPGRADRVFVIAEEKVIDINPNK
jgi:DNA ligase-associated metallophosphoesterase